MRLVYDEEVSLGKLGSQESCCDGWLCEWLRIICILYSRWLVANGAVLVVVLLSQLSDGVTHSG